MEPLPSDKKQTILETPTEHLATTPPLWEQARTKAREAFTALNAWRKKYLPGQRPPGQHPAGVRLAWLRSWRVIFALIFLVAFIAPLLAVGVGAFAQYEQLKGWGSDGVQQLLSIKDLLPLSSSTSTSTSAGSGITQKAQDVLNPKTLGTIKSHCLLAEGDFTRINNAIAHRDGIIGFAMGTSYKSKILAVQQVSLIGIDATVLCDELTSVGMDFTNSFQTSPFSSEGGPILTQKSFTDLQQGLNDTQVLLTDIQAHVKGLNLNDVPVSKTDLGTLQKYLGDIPKALSYIAMVQPYVPLAGWALGVGSQRNYLLQTMDPGELRPSGGFNGQWAILNINGGRIGPLSLADVTFIDKKSDNSPTLYQEVPELYRSWWPFNFDEWGVRDGDLSGDFPTSAKIIMQSFLAEETAAGTLHNPDVLGPTGTTLDGVIHLSPVVIQNLLDPSILGSIYVPCYDETITAANLQEQLHYYQEDGLIPGTVPYNLQNKCSSAITGTTSLRKRFTSTLFDLLQTKIKSSSQAVLLKILGSLQGDLVTKDLEIYVTNPQIESLLTKDHVDASISTAANTDATSIIQANISVNKGSTFVTENTNEYIQLDDSGGAYHDLTISLNYRPDYTQPWLFPLQTYRDYIRVYVPPNAEFINGSGFDQNIMPMYQLTLNPSPQKPLCVASPTPVPTPKPSPSPTANATAPPSPTPHAAANVTHATAAASPFPCTPAEAPSCSSTSYGANGSLGQPGSWVEHTEGSNSTYIDDIGQPTNYVSDMPGRAMYGGLVVIPSDCTATVELIWYVPHIAGTGAEHNLPYTFERQRQSGATETYTLQIVPASDSGAVPVKKSQPLTIDMSWSLSLSPNHALIAAIQRPIANRMGFPDLPEALLPESRWRP